MNLTDVIDILQHAERQGDPTDEREGSRYIHLSDTLALEMVRALQTVVHRVISLKSELKP